MIKHMKKNTLILIVFILFSHSAPAQEKTGYPFGVNLAGAEFGHGSRMPGQVGQDYFYPTTADLEYWKSKNLKLIRVPFKWERIQHDVYGEITKDELSAMKSLLKEAEKQDMQVILDLHNYGRRKIGKNDYIIGSDSLPIETLSNFWGQLSKELKNYTKSIYGYGLMNEPHDMIDTVPWTKIAQACILEIRKNDAQTPIIVGGNHWSSADRWLNVSDDLKYLYDPAHNLIFEAHVYFDEDGSGVYRRSYDEEKANPYIGVERARPFVKWLKEHNFKGFIGEYGIPDNDERWMICLDHFLAYLQEMKINGTYWAAGAKWNNYILSVQPTDNYKTDKPQLKMLQKYLNTK